MENGIGKTEWAWITSRFECPFVECKFHFVNVDVM